MGRVTPISKTKHAPKEEQIPEPPDGMVAIAVAGIDQTIMVPIGSSIKIKSRKKGCPERQYDLAADKGLALL